MSVESAADRAAFTAVGEFGVVASWTVDGGSAVDVPSIPETGALINDDGEGTGHMGQHAQLLVADEDLPAGAAQGDAVTVSGTAYLVRAILPDGTGFTQINLEVDRT